MVKYHQGMFVPKNPKKLLGNSFPRFRSSWELKVMHLLDQHPNVLQWASESIRIFYVNPFTNKNTVYIPDFLIYYQDKNGKRRAELVEIKPAKEAMLEHAKSRRDKMYLILNSAKWKAAMIFCHKHNLTFRILTEKDLFINTGSQIKKKP